MNLNPLNSRLRVPLGGAIILAMFAALPARADYQSTVLGQGPVGYWRLNETAQPPPNTTTTANLGSLASSADGTYNSSPARGLTGPFAGSVAIGLDGSSQTITTPWQAGLNPNAFSVELWVNPAKVPFDGAVSYVGASVQTASPRSGWYMAQDNGTTFGAGSAFVVRLFYQNGTTPSVQLAVPATKALGSWYHLVLTYDGTTATFYEDGVAVTNAAAAFVGNTGLQTSFGCRSDGSYLWPGQQAEVAMYGGALSAARVTAHYNAGTTAPGTYVATVQADAPVLWYRFREPPDVLALNISAAGSSLNGKYPVGTTPGVAGPRPAAYPGFEAANYAVSVPGTGPSVSVPALNLNTNTVTISGWVNAPAAGENGLAGIIMCHAGTTVSGLCMDFNGGFGLSYYWNNDNNTYTWAPTTDAVPPLPTLPSADWAYVALVVHPDQASIYVCASNNPAGFASATNHYAHVIQAFDGATLIGSDNSQTSYSFNGNIDEVAIWNRALGKGELYTQYGAAVGGLAPRIFGDLQGPTLPVAAGDPLVLSVDAGGTPPLTFTWHTNGVTAATTSSNTLVIANSSLSDGATWDVHISNGSGFADSQQVVVTVVPPGVPNIDQILGYQSRTLYPTGTLSMAVMASGGGLQYQWYKDGSPIASATASAFTIARVVATNAGSYSLSVTNLRGTATSGPPVVVTIPTPAANSYEAAIINSGPEAWWRLDETTGTTMFDGMGRHDGTYTNATGAGPLPNLGAAGALVGDPNTAASFSSAGKGIGLVPFSSDLNTPKFSIEAWVNTTVTDGQAPVSSSFGSQGWWIQSITGWWYGDSSGGSFGNYQNLNTAAAIVSGQWSHIVITFDASSAYPFTLFVNGQTDGYIWGGVPANSAGPFIIGARGVSAATLADRFFDGKVDEVAAYKRLLSGPEITAHYAARGTVVVPVTFTKPLLSQTVTTGKSISFSTGVLGTAPIYLQWYKDGAPIKDATNATYAIASTALTNAGNYTLWGTNSAATNSLSATLAVISPVGYANVTNTLVLHLTFDTDTTDSSGRGNNGTASTTTPPAFVPGIIGSHALQYTTTTLGSTSGGPVTASSYVSLGTVGSGPPADLQFGAATSFTVSLWTKTAAGDLQGDLPYIGNVTNSDNNPGWVLAPGYKNGGWECSLNDGTIGFNPNGTTPLINDGNWHNFVLTVDRTAKRANDYVDGVLAASTSIASLGSMDVGNTAPVVIGSDPTFLYPEPGTNTVDDIGIWQRALTALEVAQIDSAGSTAGRSFNTVAPPVTTITITGITVSGGTVTIKFTAGASDPASAFALLSSGTVHGTYGSAGGSISGSAGSYTATVAPSGGMQFYRIQRP